MIDAASYSFARTRCVDADEAAHRLRAWDQIYEQIAPGRFEGDTTDMWLDGMQVFRERSNRRVHQSGRAWPGSVTFGIPLFMDGDARFCGQPMGLDSVLVLGSETELDFLTSPTLDIVGISIPQAAPAMVERCQLDLEFASTISAKRLVHLDRESAARLRQLTRSVFETIEAEPTRLSAEGVRAQIRDELIDGLANAFIGVAAQPEVAEHRQNERAVVRRAREYVLAHAYEPVTIEQLCKVLGLSRRSLQYAFEHVLDISPAQYLRAARLNGVRRELKATPKSEGSIQDIAARWGFWHLGHFTACYRELFGCRPSETPRPA